MGKHSVRRHLVKRLNHAAEGARRLVSLMCRGDDAVLHDIRVQARTLASVLQPFLALPHMKAARHRLEPVKSWIRRSNRARDVEAQLELIEELLPAPYPEDVERQLARIGNDLKQQRNTLAQSRSLRKLPRRIVRLTKAADSRLERFSSAELSGVVTHACEALLSDLRNDCAAGLQDAKQWHKARLRTKRLRYLIEYFHDFLDPRFHEFAADTKLAQQNLGRLRDWRNLRAAMVDVPAISQWLSKHAALEEDLARQAREAMGLLQQKLAAWQ